MNFSGPSPRKLYLRWLVTVNGDHEFLVPPISTVLLLVLGKTSSLSFLALARKLHRNQTKRKETWVERQAHKNISSLQPMAISINIFGLVALREIHGLSFSVLIYIFLFARKNDIGNFGLQLRDPVAWSVQWQTYPPKSCNFPFPSYATCDLCSK